MQTPVPPPFPRTFIRRVLRDTVILGLIAGGLILAVSWDTDPSGSAYLDCVDAGVATATEAAKGIPDPAARAVRFDNEVARVERLCLIPGTTPKVQE